MSAGHGRRTAPWVGLTLLVAGMSILLPGVYESWRFREQWELYDEFGPRDGPRPVSVSREKIDRWSGDPVEWDVWSVSTGFRELKMRIQAGGVGHITYWNDDGTVRTQELLSKSGQETSRAPPWRFGVKDRVMDAPWREVGFEEWKKSVRFFEPDPPR